MRRNLSWIVLPTLNEAENIVGMLDGISRAMPAGDYVICIVDDGSRDGTVERVRAFMRERKDVHVELLQRQKTHRGSQRGIAVWTGLQRGLQQSAAGVFIEMDADLSHRPEELDTGLRLLREEGYNVAIASKYSAGGRVVNRSWGRRVLSFVANAAVRALITPAVTDYSNGYRFYDRRSVEIICGRPLRYGSPIYLTEVLSLLVAHHMRVGEFGSTYVGRGEGLSKLRMIDLVKAVIAVVDIAARFHLQRRPDPEHVARATTPTPVVGAARWERVLVLAVVVLMAGAAVRWAFLVDHYQQFDDLGLFNPPYMKAHYGKVTYPAHGEFRAMTVHPPLHYWIIGTLMRLGFRPYYAEAIPPFFMILLSLVLIGAGRFPVPVKLGLLFAPSVLYFNYVQPSLFGPNMRPDTHRTLALFAGLVALESGRISGWNKALLFLGSLLLTFSSALHYPGAVASAGVAVYALWVLVETDWRRASGPLAALGAGAATIGVPYLAVFVIPHHAQILQLIQAADPVAGPLASLGTHMRFYEVFWRLLRHVGPAKLLLVPVSFQIPLILLALITLLVPPSTRVLAIAALPYPMFLLLFVQRKYWGPGYFLPEILLYITGIGVAALTFLYVLTRALSTQARAAVVSISVLFIAAVLITPGLRVPHGPLGPGVHEADIARAAARSILGPGALVASRQVILFYASGAERYYDVSADVLLDEPLDPAAYFAPFDSVVEPSAFSADTWNRSHKSLTSWYADGTLKLRGFYLTAREPALPYLMLTAGTPATVEGHALSGSGELARYVQQEGGDTLLVAAVCRAGELPANSRMFTHTAFVLPPSQRAPNDPLPPVSAPQQEVTVILMSRGDHALASHVRRTCHVRDEVLLKKVSVNWHDLVATLRDDRPIRFYPSWRDAVNQHSASGTPRGGASP